MGEFSRRFLAVTSTLAALLVLAGCGERADDQTVGQTLDSTVARTAEATREVRGNMNEAAVQAAGSAKEAAGQAKQDTQEAVAEARRATQEAAGDARTSVMGAAADARSAAAEAGQQASSEVADAQITARVNAELAADRELSALRIDVDTRDGQVTLSGTVPNSSAKARANEVAKTARQVRAVDNQLTVSAS